MIFSVVQSLSQRSTVLLVNRASSASSGTASESTTQVGKRPRRAGVDQPPSQLLPRKAPLKGAGVKKPSAGGTRFVVLFTEPTAERGSMESTGSGVLGSPELTRVRLR